MRTVIKVLQILTCFVSMIPLAQISRVYMKRSLIQSCLSCCLAANLLFCSVSLCFVEPASAIEMNSNSRFQQMKSDALQNLEDLRSSSRETFDNVSQATQSRFSSARDYTSDRFNKLSSSVTHLGEDLDDVLKSKKIEALLDDASSNISSHLPRGINEKYLEAIASSSQLTGEYAEKISHQAKNLGSALSRTLQKSLPENFNLLVTVVKPFIKKGLDRHSREELQDFLESTPDQLCAAYANAKEGNDEAKWQALTKGAFTAFEVSGTIMSASAAGAGSLAGYAGLASAVSSLGLGGVTTAIASALGSSAVGAAATSVVVSAVGGPAVMMALLVGGAGVSVYGGSKLFERIALSMEDWAEQSCDLNAH